MHFFFYPPMNDGYNTLINIDEYCSSLLLDQQNNETSFKSFQFLMKYLYLYGNLIKLNKNQLINIKIIIDKFKTNESSKQIRYSEFEQNIALKYPDFIKTNYSNIQIESIILKFIRIYLNESSNSNWLFFWKGSTFFQFIFNNINNLDDTEFKIQLSNKVIKAIVDFIKEINKTKFYYNSLLIAMLSFRQILSTEDYKKYSKDIIEFFESSEFSAYNRDNFENYIDEIRFLIQLINQDEYRSAQDKELLYLKIISCGRKKVQTNTFIVDFKQLVFNYFKNTQTVYENIHIDSNIHVEVMEKMNFIIQALLENGSFNQNCFKSALSIIEHLFMISKDPNQNEIESKELSKLIIKKIVILFKEEPINETLDLVTKLINGLKIERYITTSVYLKKYLKLLDAAEYPRLINIFKINEDQVQDKEILKHSYETLFNYLKRSSTLELLLPKFFNKQHLAESKVLKEFLNQKLNHLVTILHISTIDQFVKPVFPDECNSLAIYRNKITFNNDSSNNRKATNDRSPIIPYYLITNIIFNLINNNSLYSFEKLNLLLVSKKLFEITSNIMNSSMLVPLDIYYHYHSLEIQSLGNHSIIKPLTVKWLKIKINNVIKAEFYILDAFKSLDTLEITGHINKEILNKKNFLNVPSLKRIIIKCPFTEAMKSVKLLKELGKHYQIELFLTGDYILGHRINTKMIKELSFDMNLFFRIYNDGKLSKLSRFSLIVNRINHTFADNFKILYIEKQKRIKYLELMLFYDGCLAILLECFKNLENLNTVSFKLYTQTNLSSTASDIFTVFHNNPNFKKLSQIQITDKYGYTLDIDWLSINTYNFKSLSSDFINFINYKENTNANDNNNDIISDDDDDGTSDDDGSGY
ncbi:hypothetical protein DICPUDRAFT_97600 [Dictyostelium purpureum]|uniref:Uncharacterized protein n=1 Tax=Dictyostelium purpureum TaxID=5786 RepID=F0ZI51_DICPU|nr:uncharacterized protein DICPUDRAFT_97600 [Dictyostelium purpureum]EGC36399.1 hypothetical protein DICPUDRAFT_97600 [Dictyostelium purpureum]|eukprot:XP_003287096.1 hypothetical protein DICPUDRAFT_97600 [Dictyostelium purpureum]